MRTESVRPQDIERKWHLVDAKGVPLGRLATRVASILRGKHRPTFTPHHDNGDYVVVVNARHVLLTGNKLEQKQYQRHSGIPGGFKSESYRALLERRPEVAIEQAVRGMLPKTKLGRKMRSKLKIYAGETHEHAAQNPQPLSLSGRTAG
ncbi:MAG: 50S ribosomal protein L13 [Sandaracinaceae bacterium]